MITISNEILAEIQTHARKTYPLECCGLLVGQDKGEKKVVSVYALRNLNTERTHDRYEIDPLEYMKVDREAAQKGLQIIGIYHSHPDHPCRPSGFDADRAWEGYSYIIVAVNGGSECECTSWTFHASTRTFREEELRIE